MEIAIASGPGAHDRGQDEVAQRRDVDDVDEHRARARRRRRRAMLTSVSFGRRDRDERAPRGRPAAYSRRIHSIEPSAASCLELRPGLRRDQHDAAVAGEQALDLLEPDLPAADDDAAAAGQLEAGDVERRVEHVAHAGLVADPAAELADAFFAGIGLSWHVAYTVLTGTCSALLRDALLHRRLDGAPGPPRVRGRLAGPRALLHAGRAPGGLRRLLRPHRRARRALRAPAPHGAGHGRDRVRPARGGRPR